MPLERSLKIYISFQDVEYVLEIYCGTASGNSKISLYISNSISGRESLTLLAQCSITKVYFTHIYNFKHYTSGSYIILNTTRQSVYNFKH